MGCDILDSVALADEKGVLITGFCLTSNACLFVFVYVVGYLINKGDIFQN
jgi:hypothetical protein